MAKRANPTPTPATNAEANTPTTAQVVQASHMALATSLSLLVGLGSVRVPASHRWLVGTAMWHCAGNHAEASALVATWCAAYGCALPPTSQYTTMQRWLASAKHAAATNVAKPPKPPKVAKAVPVQVPAEASAQ